MGHQGAALGVAGERRLPPHQGEGEVEHVADLEPLGLQGGGERAVDHGRLQVGLAAEHGEPAPAGQEVDHLAVPQAAGAVDR